MHGIKNRTVVVFSGGLDSTTLLYHLLAEGHEVKALTINYKQRHSKEILCATAICNDLRIEHRILELPGLAGIFGTNALTSEVLKVPTGPYQEGTIEVTTVPNRNMILLSLAIGWALSLKYDGVAFGAHAGEHTNYPDCKPPFAAAMNAVAHVCDNQAITVHSPFILWNKGHIVQRGLELGVPFEKTWSCYEGREFHCGKCSTCLDRLAAFAANRTVDSVKYEH